MTPTIYLFFDGTCLDAMTRYADILGGEVLSLTRNADAPDAESRMPGGDDVVMNMSVGLGDVTMMASDVPPDMYNRPQGFRVQIAPGTRAEFDRIFAALSDGARSIEMGPEETFWAERFAMFTDSYGTPWMLNFEGAKAPREAA
ncbi:VOC family protein [Psychromarinibacter sp. C21-152]|uniref:VOC family protein n=1 Tax=Psychromarinibacter sediminicola TaxID=3033385 RepID=A0AAE3TA05_9RHOB|nr:VOC family protein [Psychromarinibacter sediminicola]MDF0602767.1 VOC family protein [Psychromarinibacter sediminicola]